MTVTQHEKSGPTRFLIGLTVAVTIVLAVGCSDGGNDAGDSTSTASQTIDSASSSSETTTSETSSSTSESTTSSSEATSSTASTTGTVGPTVKVYYSEADSSDCGSVRAVDRTITDSVDPYRNVFQLLVAGPSDEEIATGVGSMFSTATGDVVKSAVLFDGLLTVDFSDLRTLLPNASTSCGSQALLAQLNSTAFQFADVDRTRYLIEGSCNDFANWLQRECFETARDGRQLDVSINEQASGAGCTPASTESLPAGRWFGFVNDADEDELTFDLACWFTGTAAAAAAAEDGEESPPPNDFHIRNESERLRTHPVDSATMVVWLPKPGDPASSEVIAYEEWLDGRAARAIRLGVWLTVTDDSHVVKIEEQYVP